MCTLSTFIEKISQEKSASSYITRLPFKGIRQIGFKMRVYRLKGMKNSGLVHVKKSIFCGREIIALSKKEAGYAEISSTS
jgi:hypothetical protein